MTAAQETFEFQSEARQVLDLMVHSVYSHPEIFLRELISNGSDALDKLRFEALTREDLKPLTADLHIRVLGDPQARTVTVIDNGIGMSRDEVIRFIGTIAKSGSREFLRALKESQAKGVSPELIGQFGVGFYSSFIVAEKVVLETRKAGEDKATRWESTGDGTYTLEEVDKATVGTTVTVHLKRGEEEDRLDEFAQEWKIREIVRKYSDYVAYPIRMKVQREEVERDEKGEPKECAKPEKVERDETLNSMKAIWTRSESEVTEEEYQEFYRHISHDWNEPLLHGALKAEGTIEFRALLYIPSRAPFDLYFPEAERGVQLYIKRIFIMSGCKDLLPEYLRFVRGVVDSEDLPLNISREILQKNRQVKVIRKSLVKKAFDLLKQLRSDDREKYEEFWREFGRVLKEGIAQDAEQKETLLDLGLFQSTQDAGKLTTLEEYLGRMKEGQEAIYYMTGENRRVIENSPHLEAFKEKGYEVLLLTDPVDELWVQWVTDYKEKQFQSASKGKAALATGEEKEKAEKELEQKQQSFKSLLEKIQSALEEDLKEVRLSTRLTSSPACLVGEGSDMSPYLEQLLRSSGKEVPKSKRILELNPEHAIVKSLQGLFDKNPDDPRIERTARLLQGQAILAEGGQLDDPAQFSRLLSELMESSLGGGKELD